MPSNTHLTDGQTVTIYQLLDDSTRFDVGTTAHIRAENSTDAKSVLADAIAAHGAPQEVLSDNSSAFNQLRQGTIGAVEIFLASHGTMPISGLPGKPTTQGKNERSHQTLVRFLDAQRPAMIDQLRQEIRRFRDQYNSRRPHQSLNDATPAQAWNLVEHTPATEPIPMAVLEAKAREYQQARLQRQNQLNRAGLTITKNGHVLPGHRHGQTACRSVSRDRHASKPPGVLSRLSRVAAVDFCREAVLSHDHR
jgi:hypothetical protein